MFERIKVSLGNLLDMAENRRYAWLVAIAGLLVTASCWYIALGEPELAQGLFQSAGISQDELHGRPSRLIGLLILLITVGVPFFAVQAAVSLFGRGIAEAEDESDPVFVFVARNRAERQRRVRLVAAMAGVLNLIMLIIASQ
jgi:hypothetical protein